MTYVTEDRDQPGLELSGLPRLERAPSASTGHHATMPAGAPADERGREFEEG